MNNTTLEKTYKYYVFHNARIEKASLIQYIPIEGRSFPNEWYKAKKELELINRDYNISSSVKPWPVVQTYATIAKYMKKNGWEFKKLPHSS